MRQKSRTRLVVEEKLSMFAIIFAMIGLAAAQHQNIVWLQPVLLAVIFAVVGFGVHVYRQQKKCSEPVTPAIDKICRRFGFAFVAIVFGGLLILASIANTAQGWTIFAIISTPLLISAFRDIRRQRV